MKSPKLSVKQFIITLWNSLKHAIQDCIGLWVKYIHAQLKKQHNLYISVLNSKYFNLKI